jgi:hypothetical protein
VFFLAAFVAVAVYWQVFSFVESDAGTMGNPDFLKAILEEVWSYNDWLFIFVFNHNHALVLSAHHESSPEVGLLLQASFKSLLRVN